MTLREKAAKARAEHEAETAERTRKRHENEALALTAQLKQRYDIEVPLERVEHRRVTPPGRRDTETECPVVEIDGVLVGGFKDYSSSRIGGCTELMAQTPHGDWRRAGFLSDLDRVLNASPPASAPEPDPTPEPSEPPYDHPAALGYNLARIANALEKLVDEGVATR